MKRNTFLLSLIAFLFSTTSLTSQTAPEFPNLLELDSSAASPSASLADMAWIQGHWRGTAFGGITEEIWSPPLGGSMMCVFKLVVDEQVRFYEIVTLTEEHNTLIL